MSPRPNNWGLTVLLKKVANRFLDQSLPVLIEFGGEDLELGESGL
jgi:hypothetical protein